MRRGRICNGALGFIELEQKSTRFLNFGTELNPNFATMAEAIGICDIRLEDPSEVKAIMSGRADQIVDLAKTNLWR